MNYTIKTLTLILTVAFSFSVITYSLSKKYQQEKYYIGNSTGYDFSKPTNTIKLPKILHEISGLTDIDNQTIACVQDEDGIVFIYDLEKEALINQFKFGKVGDYEGITRIENSLYILRSDGKLFEVDNYKNKDFKVTKYDTDIPVKDNEGLGYDPINNRILIAGKSKPEGKENKNKRVVFGFDLDTKKVSEKPVYTFDEEQIKQFIKNNTDEESDKEPSVKINPSAIAVHPITGKLYVLSSKDNLIYIFNQNNQVEVVHHLDKKMFNQAEGITFMDNGDMLISNEGKKNGMGHPTLLQFDYSVKINPANS